MQVGEDTIDPVESMLQAEAHSARAAGMRFEPLSEREVRLALASDIPVVSSMSWDDITPGVFTRVAVTITNPANGSDRSGLYVVVFYGPGETAAMAAHALEHRDPAWPILTSDLFGVEVGKSHRVELGFRSPSDLCTRAIRGPVIPLNVVLFNYNGSYVSRALSRFHVFARVNVPEWR